MTCVYFIMFRYFLLIFRQKLYRLSAEISDNVEKKATKIRNRYNQVPHRTQDTTWESDKNTIKHHKQELFAKAIMF